MLCENITRFRKAKGLSQEELAVRLNVVRQTVSKWERGLSVPDSELLIALADVLEIPVSTLLGETVPEPKGESDAAEGETIQAISARLETINTQLARTRLTRRRVLRGVWIALAVGIVLVWMLLICWGRPYQNWDRSDPEVATLMTLLHGAEWFFVRLSPFALLGSIAGIVFTGKSGN